jgi:hypothetical protein
VQVVACFLLLWCSSCSYFPEPEGDITYYYKVTGDASNVTITCWGSDGEETVTVDHLPWVSHKWTEYISDDESQSCHISAVNNNSDNASITVKIFVHDKMKASNTASGPNCSVETDCYFDNTDMW